MFQRFHHWGTRPCTPTDELQRGGDPRLVRLLRLGMINHGVDRMRGRSGFLAAAHPFADVAAASAAFAPHAMRFKIWAVSYNKAS